MNELDVRESKRPTLLETALIITGVIGGLVILICFTNLSNPPPAASPTVRLTLSETPGNKCGPLNFSINKSKANIVGERVHFTALIRHNCLVSAGVGLKWTSFKADGSVASSKNIWSKSISNIPPNTDRQLEIIETLPEGSSIFEVTPTDAHTEL